MRAIDGSRRQVHVFHETVYTTYLQQTLPHYIENTGNDDLIFLEMFRSSFYQDVSLNHWLTHLPPQLVLSHLRIDQATLNSIPHKEAVIVPV